MKIGICGFFRIVRESGEYHVLKKNWNVVYCDPARHHGFCLGDTITASKEKNPEANKSKPQVTEKAADKESGQTATHTVVIFYFYTQPRCVSCRNIEEFTKEAIEKKFKTELEDGRLVWKSVDLKADGNWHYVEDFQLRSKSVILADYTGRNEDKEKLIGWRNLELVWQFLRDKPAFLKYIQDETRVCLDQKYNVPEVEDKNKLKEKTEKKEKSGK